MDYHPGQFEGASQAPYQQSAANDDPMGGVEGASTQNDNNFSAHPRPQTSHSADFAMTNFTPSTDSGPFPSPGTGYQQQAMQTSRPSSGLSGGNSQGQSGPSGQNGQASQDSRTGPQEQPKAQSSVVIKVGMVGDAQIGKTSLMVKYVEGAWDEDYIQTLGRH